MLFRGFYETKYLYITRYEESNCGGNVFFRKHGHLVTAVELHYRCLCQIES